MMLPILISRSVTPVSYFFCAAADTVAAAMISPQSPRDLTRALMKYVVKKSLAQRFMSFLLGCGPGLTASCWTVSCSIFLKRFGEDSSRNGVPEAAPIQRSLIVRGQLTRKTTACGATSLVKQF